MVTFPVWLLEMTPFLLLLLLYGDSLSTVSSLHRESVSELSPASYLVFSIAGRCWPPRAVTQGLMRPLMLML